ncbi:MAG: hypothetical protein HZA54_20155 [Planctomycetes bacterium]|nr:hypothetical protein [Planctomycetota bacterium]
MIHPHRAALASALFILLASTTWGEDPKSDEERRKLGRQGPSLSSEPPLPEAVSTMPGPPPAKDCLTVLLVHAAPNCKATNEADAECNQALHWSPRVGVEYLLGSQLGRVVKERADAARPDSKSPTRLVVAIKPDRRAPYRLMQDVIRACEDAKVGALVVLTTKGRLEIGHPNRAAADTFQVAEVRVNVTAGADGGAAIATKGGPCKDDAEALRIIAANLNVQKKNSRYVPIYLDCAPTVPIGAAVHVLDLCRKAGAQDFEFLAARTTK